MNYSDRLENVAVLGAAGKMGSGIVLLTAMELADLSLQPEHRSKDFCINAIDVSNKALTGLMKYLQSQIRRAAEKKINMLRDLYMERQDLIENDDFITQYIEDVLALIRPSTHLENAYDSKLVFEAVSENIDLKMTLLSQLKSHNSNDFWVFTNTSSIPISELDRKIGLDGKILGFHFYNPPAVQRLVELILPKQTKPELRDFAYEYAKNLRKLIVPANDIAGFIGNGHFMRDALHGVSEVEKLTSEYSFAEAVYMINKVSQDFLIRPMGIFQLIDYVGLDVCQCILSVMNDRITDEDLYSPLIDRLVSMDVLGGQYANGAQKDGFLKYEKERPAGVFDPDKKEYIPFSAFATVCDEKLGPLPNTHKPWKTMLMHPDKTNVLDTVFAELNNMDTLGSTLARKYGQRSLEIGKKLVADSVAAKDDDVNKILLTGFFHVYGPINNYFK